MKRIINSQTGEITEIKLTAEEIAQAEAAGIESALENLREERDKLLAESDWTQNRDVILSNDAEWAAYRQALRDLPANTTDPTNPVWPTKPA
jgi:tyrosyl-tRNA synthetase